MKTAINSSLLVIQELDNMKKKKKKRRLEKGTTQAYLEIFSLCLHHTITSTLTEIHGSGERS